MLSRITSLTLASIIALTATSGAFAFEKGGIELTGKYLERSERTSHRDGFGSKERYQVKDTGRGNYGMKEDYGMRAGEDAKGKPDLVVSQLKENKVTYANKKNQCEFSIRVRVQNIGTATARKSKVKVSWPNDSKTKNVEGLKKGAESSKKTVTGTVTGLKKHTITAVADSKGTVNESNEGNNSKSIKITCQKKPEKK